jgi:DNA end-binding protein Ku
MAPRANWKGFLRLSLVTCPVALYPATSESEKVSFNQLNRKTGHRIKYAKLDANTGEEVANEDIVKGYKVDTDTFIEVTKEELENVALESTRTIEIDEFVDRSEIDPRYLIRPYYVVPDGKVGHDAFAVIRETIREMNKVAIGRVVLTNREHIIALEPMDRGLMGTLLRYPYEVRAADEYFDDIQDVKVTKDMLDLARHIVNQKAGHFEPAKFEDQYETALIDLINQKRAGKPIVAKERPRGERGGFDGCASQEHRRSRASQEFKAGEEAAQGRQRSEGNADADRRQEAGKGRHGEKADVQTAAEVSLAYRDASGDAGRSLLLCPWQTLCG